jgi:hypothetical protein
MRLLSILALAALLSSGVASADLRTDLARRFQVDPQYFVLNLPARPGGWVGTVYLDGLEAPVLRSSRSENTGTGCTLFDRVDEVEINLSGQAERDLLPFVSASTQGSATAVLRLKDICLFELSPRQMLARIRSIPYGYQGPKPPILVYRSYVGASTVILAKKGSASDDSWARLKSGLVQANVQTTAMADGRVELSFSAPVVIAFEVLRVQDTTKLEQSMDRRTEMPIVVVRGPSPSGLDSYKDLGFPTEKISSLNLATTQAVEVLKREFQQAGIARVARMFPVSGAGDMYVSYLEQDLSAMGLSKVPAEEFEGVHYKVTAPLLCPSFQQAAKVKVPWDEC